MEVIKMYRALFGNGTTTFGRFLQYPRTETTTSPVLPILSDRKDKLFGFKSTDGSPEPVAKGVLGTELSLSNATDLGAGSPSTTNGATQAAVRNALNQVITGIGATALTGAYNTPSGSNFLDSTTDVMDALDTLDEKVQCAWNGAIDLNTRLAVIEGEPSVSGSPSLGVYVGQTLGGGATGNTDIATTVSLADSNVVRINIFFNNSGGVANKGAHTGSGFFIFAKVGGTWSSVGALTEKTGNSSVEPGFAAKTTGLTSGSMTSTDSIGNTSSYQAILSDGNVRISWNHSKAIAGSNHTVTVEIS
jgi:hypothetical protein